MIYEVRISSQDIKDPKGQELLAEIIITLKIKTLTNIRTAKVYRLEGISLKDVCKITDKILFEPINQKVTQNKSIFKIADFLIEVAYKPGVMNPEIASLVKSARDIGINLPFADSSWEYAFFGKLKKAYLKKINRDPTDCEVEVLAQTWSEHCVHKTFNAKLVVDGKSKEPLYSRIKKTAQFNKKLIISAFIDNSGVIDFYDGWAINGKVETHNSPSAIEPYGGAMTGSGGVFRDVLGTGKGAKVIASTDIFCFAPPNLSPKSVPPGCLPPDYLLRKVVAGVRDYGNRVGIPTNNGSVHFHPDFRAKPTIVVGSYGIIPKKVATKKYPKTGDIILTIGGRTGRDGIHGATFSSGEMTDRTMTDLGSAVQIGNAIEEKRIIDVVQTLSRKNLIRA